MYVERVSLSISLDSFHLLVVRQVRMQMYYKAVVAPSARTRAAHCFPARAQKCLCVGRTCWWVEGVAFGAGRYPSFFYKGIAVFFIFLWVQQGVTLLRFQLKTTCRASQLWAVRVHMLGMLEGG